MKKFIIATMLVGAFAAPALANPVGPMPVPVMPHVFSMPVTVSPIKNMVSSYRAVRAFWLNKGIVR